MDREYSEEELNAPPSNRLSFDTEKEIDDFIEALMHSALEAGKEENRRKKTLASLRVVLNDNDFLEDSFNQVIELLKECGFNIQKFEDFEHICEEVLANAAIAMREALRKRKLEDI